MSVDQAEYARGETTMGEAGGGIPIDGGDDEPAEDDARRSGKVGGADRRPLGRRPSCHATQS